MYVRPTRVRTRAGALRVLPTKSLPRLRCATAARAMTDGGAPTVPSSTRAIIEAPALTEARVTIRHQ